GRQQPAAGDRDDDLRIEVRIGDGLRELPRGGAEQVPRQDLLGDEVGRVGVEGLGHRCSSPGGAVLAECSDGIGRRPSRARPLPWRWPTPQTARPTPPLGTHMIHLLFCVVSLGSLCVIAVSATLPTVRPPTKQVHRCTPGNASARSSTGSPAAAGCPSPIWPRTSRRPPRPSAATSTSSPTATCWCA